MKNRVIILCLLCWPWVAEGGGNVSGIVRLKGGIGKPQPLLVTTDQSICGLQFSENLLGGKKGEVQNTVAFIVGPVEGGKGFAPGSWVIRQQRCRFDPHLLVVPVGAKVSVTNEDRILHNFHTQSYSNPALNRAQAASAAVLELQFNQPEIFRYGCDLHSWMKGWIVVAEHPYYAVTGGEGRFVLTDLPAGEYTLEVWHELLGQLQKKITVREGETTEVEFTYFYNRP